MSRKRIYRFEPGRAEGRAAWKELLGGKGGNLAEMANMGIPVPPGFTLTTETCVDYMRTGQLPRGLMDEVHEAVAWLETTTGKTFGRGDDPLLVSVRSGARSSMPGMMDTILDLGLCDETVAALADKAGSSRFAPDHPRPQPG
jgi:pyruvate,orthophosphate dikinase